MVNVIFDLDFNEEEKTEWKHLSNKKSCYKICNNFFYFYLNVIVLLSKLSMIAKE